MKRSVQDYETSLLALISNAVDAGVDVRTYEGDLDPDEIKKKLPKTPAVMLLYGKSSFKREGTRKSETLHWTMLVCSKSLRADRGAEKRAAAYGMLDDLGGLDGKMPFGDEHPMDLARVAIITTDRRLSIYAAEFTVKQSYQSIPGT